LTRQQTHHTEFIINSINQDDKFHHHQRHTAGSPQKQHVQDLLEQPHPARTCFSTPLLKIFWLFLSLKGMVGGSFSAFNSLVTESSVTLPSTGTAPRSSPEAVKQQ